MSSGVIQTNLASPREYWGDGRQVVIQANGEWPEGTGIIVAGSPANTIAWAEKVIEIAKARMPEAMR
jgi:hypothetical protein